MKKRPHLVQAAEKCFLGGDHHDVGVRREELHDTLGILLGKPGAESLQDLAQPASVSTSAVTTRPPSLASSEP